MAIDKPDSTASKGFERPVSRRTAMKIIAGGSTILLSPNLNLLSPVETAGAATPQNSFLTNFGPIDRTFGDIAPRRYFGDVPESPHSVLWDKAAYLQSLGGKLPDVSEEVPLVIVGGGIAGLTSAYLHRAHNPIVLEQASRFGGNAKGMGWNGVDFSLGAAYFIEPEADSDIGKLCAEIGLDKLWRVKEGEDPVCLDGKIYSAFWSGVTAGPAADQFSKLQEYFLKVNEGEEIAYPDLPIVDEEQTEYIHELDKISFLDHVTQKAGGPLHPHIETALEHYCWSSFGASASEISAAAGLNFYASEFGNLVVFPGGNSGAAEGILSKLSEQIPQSNLRADSLVFDVRNEGDKVRVSYIPKGGAPKSILAKAVVMACPKFVVKRILEGIEEERLTAISKLRYRSYLVANILLKVDSPDPQYDMYMLGKGEHRSTDPRKFSTEQGATDVIVANFAKPNSQPYTVLTLYRGIPFDGARAELLAPTSFDVYRKSFEDQYLRDVLPLLHNAKLRPVDIRISRWGHPLPLAGIGLIADGTVAALRKKFGERVFFVEQDNWALPAFETSVTEALTAAPDIEAALA